MLAYQVIITIDIKFLSNSQWCDSALIEHSTESGIAFTVHNVILTKHSCITRNTHFCERTVHTSPSLVYLALSAIPFPVVLKLNLINSFVSPIHSILVNTAIYFVHQLIANISHTTHTKLIMTFGYKTVAFDCI